MAPVNAKVIMVVDGIPDNDPGVLNPIFIPGNTIILQAENKDFLFLSHFKQNSISVKVGESVIKNQLLGLSGNSGNSSEPHLHFHIQNRADMIKGVGIKAFFKDIIVNGTLKNNYSPLKGEIVKNN
ncbi:M23 family metallopeptidase [Polaribacter ponticola]|uniref:M23 family metallopeptidase n=1 Tax=Polaribacter ponticola TaxID=2978475 RepID=A0ABT5S8X7_9FLAO|nr:M23 family metallopeptidase [Polaribacter sp. MSW5]MDD7914538.1 M23 family metallopeptidase [Polaribacter sp. MSW5]